MSPQATINGIHLFFVQYKIVNIECTDSFLNDLYDVMIKMREKHRMIWSLSKKQGFRVNTNYKILSKGGYANFPWKAIWQVRALYLVVFFAWTATKGRINSG